MLCIAISCFVYLVIIAGVLWVSKLFFILRHWVICKFKKQNSAPCHLKNRIDATPGSGYGFTVTKIISEKF